VRPAKQTGQKSFHRGQLLVLIFDPGSAKIGSVRQKEDPIARMQSIAELALRAACAGLLLLVISNRPAASEVPDGTWLLAERVAVEVFECSGLVCGRIVWLLRPRAPDGRPDVDHLNPDPALRQRQLCGLTILWGLQADGPGHWSNGSLYDPQDGNTYDVTAERTDPDRISARVYRGVPLFGRTEILIRDPQLSFDGRC
jgi:uncharacterized protein (DUF2147 family)